MTHLIISTASKLLGPRRTHSNHHLDLCRAYFILTRLDHRMDPSQTRAALITPTSKISSSRTSLVPSKSEFIHCILYTASPHLILNVGIVDSTPGYVEGSCVTDPCWYVQHNYASCPHDSSGSENGCTHAMYPRRYAVTNATGKEVAIFDLYPDTGTYPPPISPSHPFMTTTDVCPVTYLCLY